MAKSIALRDMPQGRKTVMWLLPILGVVGMVVLFQYWPLGLTLWFGMMVASSMIPNPEFPEDLSPRATRWLRASRTLRLKSGELWRLSPGGEQSLSRWYPPSTQTGAAVCAAIMLIGVDLILSGVVGGLLYDAGAWYSPDLRPIWVPAMSGVFAWIIAHAWIDSGTEIGTDPNTGGEVYPPVPHIPCSVVAPALLWLPRKIFRKESFAPMGNIFLRLLWAGRSKRPRISSMWGGGEEAPRGRLWWMAAAFHPLPFILVGALAATEMYFQTVTPTLGWAGPLAALAGLALLWAGVAEFRSDHADQLRDWQYQQEQIAVWQERWMSLPGVNENNAPYYYQETDYPSDHPTHRQIIFGVKTGREFADYARSAAKLSPALGSSFVVLEQHQQAEGEGHWGAIRLWHDLVQLPQKPHLRIHRNPEGAFDKTTMEFAVRWAGLKAFSELSLGWPLFVGARVLTYLDEETGGRKDERGVIIESQWKLTGGMTFDTLIAATEKMQEKLECRWARFHMPSNARFVTLLFGSRPGSVRLADHRQARRLADIDWSYYMGACGLKGSNGHPPYLSKYHMGEHGLAEMVFSLPPGLDLRMVTASLEALKSTSGMGYLSLGETENPTQLALIAGEKDPLDDVYNWADYAEQVIRTPTPGEPNISWYPGVMADGGLVQYAWDDENPHLLVAGASGCGKSGIINSLLCQIMLNNSPEDVSLWMMEPKNELQAYQHIAHVDYFLDFNVTDLPVHEACAEMLDMAVKEMDHRYSQFSSPRLSVKPRNLAAAREMAKKDPEGAGFVNFPWLFILIEECSTYFDTPALKEEKTQHTRLVSYVTELARKGRAAGVYLILATQDPTKQNLPTTLKRQCRKIGLRTNDLMGSRVIIDQPGLEKIKPPGRGKVSGGRGYIDFRGFFIQDEEREELLTRMPVDRRWPKLPPVIEPKPLVLGTPIVLPDGSIEEPIYEQGGEVA